MSAEHIEQDDSYEVAEQLEGLRFHSNDPTKDYLYQISKTPLLTAEQEVSLAIRIEAGLYASKLLMDDTDKLPVDSTSQELEWLAADGEAAYQGLYLANLRLVVSIAKRSMRGVTSMSLLDVVQEGNIGLMRAVEKFDYTKGYKFSTYATWWIRQAIEREKANKDPVIRLPIHANDELKKSFKEREAMIAKLGREPTEEELAEEIGITVQRLREIRDMSRAVVSTNELIGDGDGSELGDLIAFDADKAPRVVETMGLQQELAKLMFAALTEREEEIIVLRYALKGDPVMTLKDIGLKFGISSERVRQIESVAIRKLRGSSKNKDLVAFFKD